MDLLNQKINKNIEKLVNAEVIDEYVCNLISETLSELYKNIPDNRRISYGRVYTLKVLTKESVKRLQSARRSLYDFGSMIFENCNNHFSKGLGLGIITASVVDDLGKGFEYFEKAAGSEHWDLREFTQMYFKQIIKTYPEEAHEFLLEKSLSANPNTRRFVSETLRPVQENKWMQEKSEYSLGILKNLFREKVVYPRTSVGNNLSDLARKNPQLILEICKDLVAMDDKNAYWIANRACRNLVKLYPKEVMDILKVDEYKYKRKVYKRSEYQ